MGGTCCEALPRLALPRPRLQPMVMLASDQEAGRVPDQARRRKPGSCAGSGHDSGGEGTQPKRDAHKGGPSRAGTARYLKTRVERSACYNHTPAAGRPLAPAALAPALPVTVVACCPAADAGPPPCWLPPPAVRPAAGVSTCMAPPLAAPWLLPCAGPAGPEPPALACSVPADPGADPSSVMPTRSPSDASPAVRRISCSNASMRALQSVPRGGGAGR